MEEVREIVIPGELLGDAKEKRAGYGTFIEDGKIISKFLGLPKDSNDYLSVIPLSGVYIPRKEDKVIGFITDVEKAGWLVDINSPWQAFLPLSEGVDEFIDFKRTDINEVQLFKLVGIQGTGTVSGKYIMINGKGHIEFVTKDARFEPAIFSGIKMPLNFFHRVTGSIDINGKILNIVSVYLEGKDISARLKGAIRDAVMDLNMELMPGKSFIENPLFIAGLEKYKISPGYYMIPARGNLSL